MSRLLRFAALVFYLGLHLPAAEQPQAGDIVIGTPTKEVVRIRGQPKARLIKEDREIYVYDHYEITFKNGLVTRITPKRGANLPPKTTPAPAPVPAVTHAPPPSTEAVRPTTPVTILGVLGALWPFYLILVLLLPIAEILRRLVKRHRRGKAKHAETIPAAEPNPATLTTTGNFSKPALTANLLQRLEWKRFELLVILYFRARGLRIDPPPADTDSSIKLCLYRDGEAQPHAFVQCRTGNRADIDLKEMHEFLGTMATAGVDEGVFVTSGAASAEALEFAEANGITAIAGVDLVEKFYQLPVARQQDILMQVTAGDYTTPTCPKCDLKLELRGEGTFWGCVNWPQCRTKIFVRRTR